MGNTQKNPHYCEFDLHASPMTGDPNPKRQECLLSQETQESIRSQQSAAMQTSGRETIKIWNSKSGRSGTILPCRRVLEKRLLREGRTKPLL